MLTFKQEWIRSRDREDESEDLGLSNGSGASRTETNGGSKSTKVPWVPVPDDPTLANSHCPICQEKFETVWSDDVQEWVWMDALRVGDRIYHASCHAEISKTEAGPATTNPKPSSKKRKAEASSQYAREPARRHANRMLT